METPTKLYAAILGLTAFLVAVMGGLLAGTPASDVLSRAIVSMTVCYGVGAVLGMISGLAIKDFVRDHHTKHPITDMQAVAAEYDALPEAQPEVEPA